MKPSHLQTPRSLDECNFTPGYVSYDYDDDGPTWTGMAVRSLAAIVVTMGVIFLLYWKP